MTSTSFNIGLNDNTRLSSRVLRPPGGGHTDIFGGEPEPTRTGRRITNSNAATASSLSTGAAIPPTEEVNKPSVPQSAPPPAVVESPPAVEAPLAPTPEAPAQQQPTQPQRARVPPGGYSSGLW